MFIDVLLKMMKDTAMINIVVIIKSALNLNLSLVKDLLDLKLIKENKFNRLSKTFNPIKVLEFVKSMFQMQADQQKVKLSYKTVDLSQFENPIHSARNFHVLKTQDLPENLVGDKLRLEQILINLIKNALKFTQKSNGYVRILIGYDNTCDRLIVAVADSGKGITREEMPLLCQQFGKIFRTAKMNSDGIGLGLKISKALIEANQGMLQIYSDGIDQGSVFQFTMKMTS